MRRVRVIRLGTECRDKAIDLAGTITHWLINMSGKVDYLFQPRGLDEAGQPFKKLYLCEERLSVKKGDFEEVEIPFEILGTQVTDKASGFTGMAVQFIRHINGCFHVEIQPRGVSSKGVPINSNDFDLRGCAGKAIRVMTKEEQEKSERETPSPTERPQRRLPE